MWPSPPTPVRPRSLPPGWVAKLTPSVAHVSRTAAARPRHAHLLELAMVVAGAAAEQQQQQ
eukprot:scaffold2252_cov47-Phaeocystis_antarctica.AAC.1